jgi:hypothetical protein
MCMKTIGEMWHCTIIAMVMFDLLAFNVFCVVQMWKAFTRK